MEYPVRNEGNLKRVDYAFRNDADNMFFVEAKAPKEDLLKHSFQARSYGWSAGHEICVLTNFKNIIIYNTKTIDPKKQNDPATVMANINCNDYIKRFDDIYELLSFERVNQGSIREYAVKKGIISATPSKGDYTVDEAFLKLIEDWRDKLARNIILRQQDTTKDVLTFATQKIIDRIIFLRIAEDRGIEDWRNLQNIATNYKALCQYFQEADKKYNSGLFHFTDEANRGVPDKITQTLKIDSDIIVDIIASLYDGRYQFGVMPTYILGSVYERFLGKEINLDGKNVKVEDKLEVRKAGGVYYTPEYIAKYIVENTIDKNQIKNNFTILDPACGSGSFLLVAYDYMLRFYQKTYKRNLTIQERKQILLDHIYGVDLDEQAVEVTKLSLHLKLLEGIDEHEINNLNEKALPSLHNNIKCGGGVLESMLF
jgi:type I restriction-modification system DNA methylase subunit